MRPCAAIVSTLLLLAAAAPPAGAAPCLKPRQLKLLWDGTSGDGQLVFVTYGCAMPPKCPAKAGTLATKAPLKISLKAGDTQLFATELRSCTETDKCRSLNTGGCPNGTDAHKAPEGLVKYSYQRQGTASVMVRARAPMKQPAETKGPVVATVSDADGYTSEVTFAQCRFSSRPKSATMVCR